MTLRRILQPDVLCEILVGLLLAFTFLVRAGKGIESTWVMAFVAGLVVFLSVFHKGDRRVPAFTFWTGIAFLLLTGLSFVFSSVRTYGLDVVMRDAAGFLFFTWIVTRASESTVKRILQIVTGLVLVAAVIGIAVYVLQPVNRFVGVFFNILDVRDYWPNAWAEFVLLAWPVALLIIKKKKIWIRSLLLGFLGASLLLSYSRGAAIVLVLQIFLLINLWKWSEFRRGHLLSSLVQHGARFLAEVLAVVAVAGILFVSINTVRSHFFPVESVIAKATLTAEEGTQTVDERKQFWQQAWTLSIEKPWLGWGPGTFRFVQPRLQQNILATSDHPHNFVLKDAMERGWPAAILFLLFLCAIIFPGMRSALSNERSLYVTIAVVGTALHNLIDYNLQFVLIAALFWILLGVLSREAWSAQSLMQRLAALFPWSKKVESSSVLQRTLCVILATGLLLVVVIEGRFLALERLGQRAEALGQGDSAIAAYTQAQHMLFPRDLHLNLTVLLLQQENIQAAAKVIEEAKKLSPEDARVWILLGDLSLESKRNNDARTAYTMAMTLNGWNDLRPLHGILETLGRSDAQAEITRFEPEADKVMDTYAKAIELNMHFIAQSWLADEFQAVSKVMRNLYPADTARIQKRAAIARRYAERSQTAAEAARKGFLW